MFAEPRTNLDIMLGILNALKERVWVETRIGHGCNCCRDEWEMQCSSCGAEPGDYKSDDYQTHNPGCELAALILEAETFIRIEEQLQEERELQAEGA